MAKTTTNTARISLNRQFKLITNAIAERSTWIRKWLDKENRDIDVECGYPVDITIQDYKSAYERGDIAARLVEIYPHESWQEPPDIYEQEENTETAFEKAWIEQERKHNLVAVLQRIDILSGIGRFGIVLIGINDGKDLKEPVAGVEEALMATIIAPSGTPSAEPAPAADTPATTPIQIIYLRTFDESTVQIKAVEKRQSNPRFGQPTIYTLKFQDPQAASNNSGVIQTIDTDVHWTRVLHVTDNRADSDIFGQPRLKRIYNRLLDLKKVMGGSGEMFWRGGFPGLSIETQPVSGDDAIEFDPVATKKEIELYQRGLKRYLALVGMTAKSLAPQIADPTNHMNAQIRIIAIAWGIPWRILMGAELGQLASEQDITAWNKKVARRQKDYVGPYIIVPFVLRLIAMKVLPALGASNSVLVAWSDTHTVTETDKATVAEKITNSITKYVQGGGDLVMDLFHYLTLVLKYTDNEANSIIAEVGTALEDDREMKQAQAELAMESTNADIKATQAGGAGNGNANGAASGTRGTAPAKKSSSAAAKNQ